MIPRLNDFLEMAALFDEKYSDVDLSNVVIEFSVSNGILQKINEELFYKNNGTNMVYGNPEPTDIVEVNIGPVRFRCVEEKIEGQE